VSQPTAPKLRDVAAAAGVSVSTVSYALNGKGRVDPATRARIREIATQLGYSANPLARGLQSGRTSTLGLLTSPISSGSRVEALSLDWYGKVAMGAAQASFEADHALLLLPAIHDVAQLRRQPVEGLIVVDPAEDDPRLPMLAQAGIPAVSLGRDPAGYFSYWVGPDTDRLVRELLDHLASQGAARVMLLAPRVAWEWITRSVSAYHRWCASRHLAPDVVFVDIEDALSPQAVQDAAYHGACQALAARPRPDAVLALCLGFAVGVLNAASELGLRVPHDLLLAQDADEPSLRTTTPPVTAVDMFPEHQARTAVTMLLSILDGNPPSSPVTTPTQLHRRPSSQRCLV
jgi:DNA-binding LacI/PurR family transcriptional regulator